MAADQQNTPELFPKPSTDKESGSFLPWIIAGVVVAVGVGLLFLFVSKLDCFGALAAFCDLGGCGH